jgi:CRISPR-associated protein (TIGR02584 family)
MSADTDAIGIQCLKSTQNARTKAAKPVREAERAWREVLIVTGGLTPQVVTETVYGLARPNQRVDEADVPTNDRIVPHRIICVVTQGVARRFLDELDDALLNLAKEWDIEPRWGKPLVQVPTDGGRLLTDVRTYEDSVVFGDFVTELVRRETLDDDTRVHLSIAGGRKTMSFHGGAALGLWGRPQDQLSHVLVAVNPEAKGRDPSLEPEDFEHSSEFWHPTRNDHWITGRDGKRVNARDAAIDLADVPFVPLRDLLPPWMAEETLSYRALVERFRAALSRRLVLRLTTSQRRVRIGQFAEFRLPPVQFALYQLMAEWACDEIPGAGPAGIGGKEHRGWLTTDMLAKPHLVRHVNPIERYLRIYDSVSALESAKAPKIRDQITPHPNNTRQERDNRRYFRDKLSHLRKRIARELKIPVLFGRFGSPPHPSSKEKKFGLELTKDEIIIEP